MSDPHLPGPPPRIAVFGLGIIGTRAANRLADAGCVVTRWNRTPRGQPGEAPTAREAAAGATLLSLYLKDAPAVRAVAGELLPVLPRGCILLNHSTIDLDTTRWLAAACHDSGVRFLDCPFTGSREAAAAGKLVYYCSGAPDLLAEVTPILLLTAQSILPCGPVAGQATVLKLATNLISACTVQALSEALAIATRNGISAALFTDAVARNACGSPLAAMKLPTMAGGDFATHFSLDNMRKDARYALALAASAALPTPAISAVAERMTQLCQQGHGDLDYSALAMPYLERR